MVKHVDVQPNNVKNSPEQGFWVYVLWGSGQDTPLYVGQSKRLRQRLCWHMSDPDKRRLIARIEIIACEDLHTMRVKEFELIRDHQPHFNSKGATAPTGLGWGCDSISHVRMNYEDGLSYYDVEVLSRPILPPISLNKEIAEIPEWQYYSVIAAVRWLQILANY